MITVRNCGIVRWIIEKLLALVQLTRGSFNPGLPYNIVTPLTPTSLSRDLALIVGGAFHEKLLCHLEPVAT